MIRIATPEGHSQVIVCLCNGVSERDIEACVAEGASSLKNLREQLGVGRDCGKCASCARQVLRQAKLEQNQASPGLQPV
jgi:bacterioferritin-associated ferredoxin